MISWCSSKAFHVFAFSFYSHYFFLCRDVWNYVDIMTLIIYVLIVILRITTMARGGDPYHNRLLEIVNYLYGVNTLFLILRFSSILELNSVVGPLQLALFRMCVDLLIILIQFCFVIGAFTVAITKSYIAEMSYLTPTNNQTGKSLAEHQEWVLSFCLSFSLFTPHKQSSTSWGHCSNRQRFLKKPKYIMYDFVALNGASYCNHGRTKYVWCRFFRKITTLRIW